jgi:carbonic anhydrase/acetyltransferase-like protein (isoleucine patch superfamily)
MSLDVFIDNIRSRSNPFYQFLYDSYKSIQKVYVPVPPVLAQAMYSERTIRHNLFLWFSNKFYYEPILRSRCASVGRNMQTDGDIPLILGSGKIVIGDNVKIGNRNAWILSSNLYEYPELTIGSHTVVNYQVVISVECRVTIGSNCQIAGESIIFDNNSHSIYYTNDRKMSKDDTAPITIEDNVWIGMRSMIMKGVTIGRGSVIAAGSVVTKDVPSMTVVGGNPARVLKEIKLP